MQEEVENKTMILLISGSKLTYRLMARAFGEYLRDVREKKILEKRKVKADFWDETKSVDSEELKDGHMEIFDKHARKYGIKYAVREMKSEDGNERNFCIFFDAKKRGLIHKAMNEYIKETEEYEKRNKNMENTSVLEKLNYAKGIVSKIIPERKRSKKQSLEK